MHKVYQVLRIANRVYEIDPKDIPALVYYWICVLIHCKIIYISN